MVTAAFYFISLKTLSTLRILLVSKKTAVAMLGSAIGFMHEDSLTIAPSTSLSNSVSVKYNIFTVSTSSF